MARIDSVALFDAIAARRRDVNGMKIHGVI